MIRCLIFPAWSSFAIPHELGAPLLDRFMSISTRTWCSAAWPSLAFLRELDAPLLDLPLRFYMNLLLRCSIYINLMLRCLLRCLTFTCNATWTWCSAAWSSFAFLHELDAPLLDLHLQVYMNLMLRFLIFTCISTWTRCSAAWPSLASLHELDAPLLDLHVHFYMNLMLRCLTFTCNSTWTGCSAAWSSFVFLHELDAPLLDLHLQVYMNYVLRCLIFIVAVRSSDCQSVTVRPSPSDRRRQTVTVIASAMSRHIKRPGGAPCAQFDQGWIWGISHQGK